MRQKGGIERFFTKQLCGAPETVKRLLAAASSGFQCSHALCKPLFTTCPAFTLTACGIKLFRSRVLYGKFATKANRHLHESVYEKQATSNSAI